MTASRSNGRHNGRTTSARLPHANWLNGAVPLDSFEQMKSYFERLFPSHACFDESTKISTQSSK